MSSHRVADSLHAFIQDPSVQDSVVIRDDKYIRTCGPERKQTEILIKNLYGGVPEATFITSSGMNSIITVFNALIKKIKHELVSRSTIFVSDELYCDTQERGISYLEDNGFNIISFDQSDYDSTVELIKFHSEHIVMMFFEVCSNPHGKTTDFRILDALPVDTYVVVDNTWLSPVVCNPFKITKRIDCVVESCTKYISGSTTIAGHIACRSKKHPMTTAIEYNIRLNGIHVSPMVCSILNEQIGNDLRNIKERIQSSLDRTYHLIRFFEEAASSGKTLPGVTLFNSGLQDKSFKSSIILFEVDIKDGSPFHNVKTWRSDFEKLIKENCTNVLFETSYGKKRDAICNFPQKSDDKKRLMIRLSLGFAESKDTVKTLYEQLLNVFSRV